MAADDLLQYEFLMHAMLGLAASHLTVTTRADYSSIALQHRVKAIQGFNEALSKQTRSGSDGDALLAAVYALTFQSSYLSDGLREFLTLIRGCALVSYQMIANDVPISFSISLEEHHEYMSSRLHDLPTIDGEFVRGAQQSLAAISPLLMQNEYNLTAHKALVECINAAEVGGPMAYYKFIAIHNALYSLGHQAFRDFIDSKNEVGLVLLGHFVAIELIMSPIYSREWKGRVLSVPMNGIIDWVAKVQDEVSLPMQDYLAWPKSIVALVRREMKEKRMVPWLREIIIRQ